MGKLAEKSAKKIKTSGNFNYTAGLYAVQCCKCFKWRSIPTKDEFETIRGNFIEDPWWCNKNPDVTCDDPGDLENDDTRIWVYDKPNIPKPPDGFEREVIFRKDFTKADALYTTPTGKKVRAPAEVEQFLDANLEYRDAGVSVSSFNFSVPKILYNTRRTDLNASGGSARKGKNKL